MSNEQQRFQAAVAAMQGILSSAHPNAPTDPVEVAKHSALFADALLAELDRTKPEPATPQPGPDGWIPHVPGDPCPCDGGLKVRVKLADGKKRGGLTAAYWSWDYAGEYSVVAWKPA